MSEHLTEKALWSVDYWQNAASMEERDGNSLFETKETIVYATVLERAEVPFSQIFANKILQFLLRFFRYGADGPGANLLCERVHFDRTDLACKRITDSNGISREYLSYLPETARSRQGKIPLAAAFHRIAEPAWNYFELIQWYRKADEAGFALVMPEAQLIRIPDWLTGGKAKADQAGWHVTEPERRHTNLQYVEDLLNRVVSEFPIDEGRIYCTGHSMGCMMTNYIASEAVGARFAAFGGTSGILYAGPAAKVRMVPMFLTMGEYDLWNYELSGDGLLTASLDFWLKQNGPAKTGAVRKRRTSGIDEVIRDGRYHHSIWKNAQGVLLLCYTWVQGKEHTP